MKDTIKEIIKQEWEAEFPNDLGEPIEIEDSIFSIYQELVERICAKVWNSALELAADNAEIDYKDKSLETFVDIDSILKLKIKK